MVTNWPCLSAGRPVYNTQIPIHRPACQYTPAAYPQADLRIGALFSKTFEKRKTKENEKQNEKLKKMKNEMRK